MRKILCIAISFCLVLFSSAQRRNLVFESPFDELKSINSWYERSLGNSWSATMSNTIKRAGRSAIRFELRKGIDTTMGVRAELGTEPQSLISEFLYAFSNYFPEDYRSDPSGEIVSQWQAKPDLNLGENWRSPPLALEIKNDRFYLAVRWSAERVNTNFSIAYLDLGPVEHEKWHDWVVRVKWRHDNTGILQVWKNGMLVVNRVNKPVGYNDFNYPYFKIGIYKWDWQGPSVSTSTVRYYYADEVRIGNSLATYTDVFPSTLKVTNDPVISTSISPARPETLTVFPNPAQNGFVLSVDNTLAGQMKLEIVDIGGNPIRQFILAKTPGLTRHYIPSVGLVTGRYVLRASLGNWSQQTILIAN